MWISPRFQLLLVKEYQRLKEQEQAQIGWTAKRELSKINYRIHTDAIKQNLIPTEITPAQASIIYAEEADVLNVAMFGITAKIWHEQNPELKGNIRDYASINELICLSNMENLNAVFIDQGIPQGERLIKLKPNSHSANAYIGGMMGREIVKVGIDFQSKSFSAIPLFFIRLFHRFSVILRPFINKHIMKKYILLSLCLMTLSSSFRTIKGF